MNKKTIEALVTLECVNKIVGAGKYFNLLNDKVHFEHEKGEYTGIALPCKHKKSRAKRKGKKY